MSALASSNVLIDSQPDEQLVALARAGHEPAFVVLVERYRRELGAHARRLDSGRAEDIVQQTFLSAFMALRSGAEIEHLRGWLHQILRNAAIRSASREGPAAELDVSLCATGSLEDAVESRMLARDLLSELTRLPDRQREAIVAMSIAGRSRAEISSSMGVTEGAVRQLVHRARATLRTAVAAVIPYPIANFLAAAGGGAGGDGAAEVAIGAGAVSAAGAVAKLGALITSGVIATAVVSSLPSAHHPRRPSTPSSHGALAAPREAPQPALLAVGAAHARARPVGSSALTVAGGSAGRPHPRTGPSAGSHGPQRSQGSASAGGNGNGTPQASSPTATGSAGPSGGHGGGQAGGDGSPTGVPAGSSTGGNDSGGSAHGGGSPRGPGGGGQPPSDGSAPSSNGDSSPNASGADSGSPSGVASGSGGRDTSPGGAGSAPSGSGGDSGSNGDAAGSGGDSGSGGGGPSPTDGADTSGG